MPDIKIIRREVTMIATQVFSAVRDVEENFVVFVVEYELKETGVVSSADSLEFSINFK
jgi:hypothetical protein